MHYSLIILYKYCPNKYSIGLSCFAQVMQDTHRLVKRSQLKRSQYKILGKPSGSCDMSHDAHLRDYDEEIFDDGDFYHQVNHYEI